MVSKKFFGVLAVLVSFMLVFAVGVSSQSSNAPQKVIEKIANQTKSDPSELNATPSNLSRISSSNDIYGNDVKVFEIRGRPLGKNPVIAITAGGGGNKKPKKSGIKYTRSILSFGYAGNASGSEFLETSAGVQTSSESGVVMMRSGSVTGISTSIDDSSDAGEIEVKLYKNGKEVGLRNSFEGLSEGNKVDVDRQSQDIVKFERGDVISVKVSTSDGNSWSNAITSVEITTK